MESLEFAASYHVSLPSVLRFSALHHAALVGSLELISLLLEAQATVDIKDINGKQLVGLRILSILAEGTEGLLLSQETDEGMTVCCFT